MNKNITIAVLSVALLLTLVTIINNLDQKPLYVVTASKIIYPKQIELADGTLICTTSANLIEAAYSMTTDTGFEVTVDSDMFYAEGKVYVPIKGGTSEHRFTIFYEDPHVRSVTIFHNEWTLREPTEGDYEFFPSEPPEMRKIQMLKVAARVADELPKAVKH